MSGARILITGMSGVGKSSVLGALEDRGWRAVEADTDEALVEEHPDRTELRLPALEELLREPVTALALALSVTGEGQGQLYPLADHVVLLTAPWEVLRQRIADRADNAFGKEPGQLDRIRADLETYEPLLRQGADLVIDTSAAPFESVVDQVAALATTPGEGR